VREVFDGLDARARDRVQALRAQGRFFRLDVSLAETSPDDIVDALRLVENAVRARSAATRAHRSRRFHADRASLVFAIRCFVAGGAGAGQTPLGQAVDVDVVITGDYLLMVHA
jgi:hypothetical protein